MRSHDVSFDLFVQIKSPDNKLRKVCPMKEAVKQGQGHTLSKDAIKVGKAPCARSRRVEHLQAQPPCLFLQAMPRVEHLRAQPATTQGLFVGVLLRGQGGGARSLRGAERADKSAAQVDKSAMRGLRTSQHLP